MFALGRFPPSTKQTEAMVRRFLNEKKAKAEADQDARDRATFQAAMAEYYPTCPTCGQEVDT
jgi:hypothetical protein